MGMNWAILQEDKLNYSSQNDRKFSEKKKVRHVGKPRFNYSFNGIPASPLTLTS